MNLLKLTRNRDETDVYINFQHITSMEDDAGCTYIVANGKNHWVLETKEQIVEAIFCQLNQTNR